MDRYYFQIFQLYNFNNLRSLIASGNNFHIDINFVQNNDHDCIYLSNVI